MAERLSLSELARQLGRAKSGLHKLAASGQIPKGEDGKYDLDEVKAALADNIDPSRQTGAFTRSRKRTDDAAEGEQNDRSGPSSASGPGAGTAQGRIREILQSEGIELGRKPLTFAHVRQAEKIIQVRQRDQDQAIEAGRFLDADDVTKAWASDVLKFRARMQSLSADIAMTLPHLTKHDIVQIEGLMRDALDAVSDEIAA